MSAYRITRKGSLCFDAMTTRTPLKHNDPMRLKIAASVIVCVTILVVAEFSNAATGLDIHKKLLALGSVVFAAMNIGSIITWLKGAHDASRVLFYSVMPLMLITVAVNEGHAIVLTRPSSRQAARSRSRLGSRRRMWSRSQCLTQASGSRRKSARGCSLRSSKQMVRRRESMVAPGWVWRSSSSSPSCSVERSRSSQSQVSALASW